MRQRRRNVDEPLQGLRRLYAQNQNDAEVLGRLVAALVRAGDHRGLVALGPAAVPVLRELDDATVQQRPSPARSTDSLVRRARVDIVRLELSILGRQARFTARPLGNDDVDISLWMSNGAFDHRDSDAQANGRPLYRYEVVEAHPVGGGLGRRIPLEDVIDIGEAATRAYDQAAGGWRIASLGLDGEKIEGKWVKAWLFGSARNGARRWNGWARPFMTLDQVRAFVELWSRYGEDPTSGLMFELRETPEGLVVAHYSTNDPEEPPVIIHPEWVEGANAPEEEVYDMGCGLIWDEADGEA